MEEHGRRTNRARGGDGFCCLLFRSSFLLLPPRLEERMTPFLARRGGPRRPVRPAVPRIGHFYLAAAEHKMFCLNETAKQFVREGVPLTARDLARQPLVTLDGQPVVSQNMPMVRA